MRNVSEREPHFQVGENHSAPCSEDGCLRKRDLFIESRELDVILSFLVRRERN